MSLLDYNEQYDWYRRMRMEREDEVEAHIRDAARQYCERSALEMAASPGNPHTHLGQRIVMAQPAGPSMSTAGYVAPGASLPASQVYIDVKIDVDPHITGFARQIIAEEQIREQINKVEFP